MDKGKGARMSEAQDETFSKVDGLGRKMSQFVASGMDSRFSYLYEPCGCDVEEGMKECAHERTVSLHSVT